MTIRTCPSLRAPGRCCRGLCTAPATTVVWYGDLIEHTRCDEHSVDVAIVATRPILATLAAPTT